MAPRPIWSGTISFGLVSIPVRMLTATSSRELRFHFVDRRDLEPIGYDKVRKDTGEHVDPDDVVRAFELEKGRYVPIEPEDLDRLDVELTHSVDICDFVSLDEIDPIYFRQAYYLVPQEGGEKPYRLLVQALEETGRVGIAKVVIRNKQHLACLRPYSGLQASSAKPTTRGRKTGRRERRPGGVLVVETMYYADEVRRPSEVADEVAGEDGLRRAEVEMAKTLVENLSAEFDPDRYDDTYRSELLELIRSKAEGAELPEPREEEAQVVDLMQALRESVERTQKRAGSSAGKAGAARPDKRRAGGSRKTA
jgi:DNA end-binding protein Ku